MNFFFLSCAPLSLPLLPLKRGFINAKMFEVLGFISLILKSSAMVLQINSSFSDALAYLEVSGTKKPPLIY